MGVKNLWDILESCKKTLPLHHLQNKRVCIDLSCWIVQLHNVNKTHCAMKEKLYLRGLFHRVRALIALNCSVIFVAGSVCLLRNGAYEWQPRIGSDGSIPAIKLSTYRRRLNLANEVSQEETISHKVSSLRRNMGSEFSCMIKEAKLLGVALGIPCLDGIEEAEAQCALLNSESLCDGCFTSDSDAFLFGARTVYRDICLGEGGHVVCYEVDDIERKLGFGRNSLISLAVLLGSDYSSGVHGIGQESACRIVKAIGDSAVLQKIASEGLSFAKKPKGSKKQGQTFTLDHESDHNLQKENLYIRVINAYLKPKCHSADSFAVRRVVALYPFNRQQLQHICNQYFNWPPEKTDEYILPKIAERDLRRFANLRHTSSELGLRLSLDEMPIKCPIYDIVKQKKLQGRDCFEVSWEKLDGLETSVVPADLVESACPEKIQEFQERRAQAKKPKSRKSKPKKVQSDASLEDINLKFDRLLLDIEQQSSAINSDTFNRGSTSENIADVALVDRTNQGRRINSEIDSDNGRNATIGCSSFTSYRCNYSTSSMVNETEVIDLLSPSPMPLTRRVAKVTEIDVQRINVIDLSESENEMSPEHEKRARELRLFIANI